MNEQLQISLNTSPASPQESPELVIIVGLEPGDRVQVVQSDIPDDIGRIGTVQKFRECTLTGRTKVLLDGDQLSRFFRRHQLEMVFLPPAGLEVGDRITTSHGKATVTRISTMGKACIIWARYGYDYAHPHLTRSVLAVEKGDRGSAAAESVDEVLVGNDCHAAVPEFSAEVLVGSDRIAQLQQERRQILASGELAPAGAWLNKGKVSRKNFIQVFWKADQPIFRSKETGRPVKRQYIGEVNSPEHRAALEAVERRNRVKAIDRELKRLEKERSQ